jgi:hypothetical protein
MNLKLTGKTDLLLSETNGMILEFTPGSAPVEQKEIETIAGLVLLGTRETVQETVRKIEDYFDSAQQAQKDLTLPKIYLEVDTGGGYVRSEILDGILDTETEYYNRISLDYTPVRIWIKRKNYWEGAEAQIPLTNENGTNNTTGLTVFNTNDMTGTPPTQRVNYVKMTAANLPGSIPAPPRIEITNTYSSGETRLSNVWLGRSIDDAINPFQWFVPHEVTKNTTASTEQQISLTELDTNFLGGTKGGHYRIFTKVQMGYKDLRLNIALYFPASVALTPMQKAPEVVQNSAHVVDLGTLQIPPWLPDISDQAPVGLRLGARRAGGFNQTFFDYFLFPANAFRQLIPRGYGIATGITLADDGITETVWTEGWTGGGKTGHYSGYGDWITLIPGKDQRLLFLFNTMTGGYDDAITATIKVFYRPRRLTP